MSRRYIIAASDLPNWAKCVGPFLVFMLWTLTSFSCHKLAKMALLTNGTKDPMTSSLLIFSLLVTLVQLACCCAVVKVTYAGDRLFFVIAASHALATLATNSSLALTFASATMAIKMLEPVTSAVLQVLILEGPMKKSSIFGMIVIVTGAVLYVGNPLTGGAVTQAILMAFISNLTLSVRNVAIKGSYNTGGHGRELRPILTILYSSVCFGVVLLAVFLLETKAAILPKNATYFLFLSTTSGIFHVTYSYLSTNLVLRALSVVSHALANIIKRVLVVLLLHLTGQRSASLWNWVGLAMCAVGLFLYQRKDSSKQNQSDKSGTTSTTPVTVQATPLRYLLYGFFIVYGLAITPSWTSLAALEKLSLLQGNDDFNFTLRCQKSFVAAGNTSKSKYQYFSDYFKTKNFSSSHIACQQNKPCKSWFSESTEEFYSQVTFTNPTLPKQAQNLSQDYALNLLYGHVPWRDGQPLMKDPIQFQPTRKTLSEVLEFLSRRLTTTPFDTDGLSPYLTDTRAVIAEAERVHLNLFADLMAGKKYAILFGWASFENKGDPAISIGEAVLLEKMGIRLIDYINVDKCGDVRVGLALKLASNYSMQETIILMRGGGNIIGYFKENVCRKRAIKTFTGYQLLLFSESVFMRATKGYMDYLINVYCCNSNLTILLRDRKSLYIARRIFTNGTRLLLAPDMALANGPVARYARPYYDVFWLHRTDLERPLYDRIPLFPANVSLGKGDWVYIPSLKGKTSFTTSFNILMNGYEILQRGRVVITERLHGHILSVLLDIPHVLLDNSDLKLSSFYNTWTRGISNCHLADNAQDAARLAMELLAEFNYSLPRRLQAVDIKEVQ